MIRRLAVSGYRSLRDVVIDLAELTVVTGPNGSGKSSLYRSLRLLSEVAQGRIISSLAIEGGLNSTLWAGPETISTAMRQGVHPVQGTRRSKPVSLKLGFASDDYSYAIDLGLPGPSGSAFADDPEIKVEALWVGEALRPSALVAERRGGVARVRSARSGEWVESTNLLSALDSLMTHRADIGDGFELLRVRERMRDWRFYDDLRTDRSAPARQSQVGTYTPILAGDGRDLGAAIQTIMEFGNSSALEEAVADAFDGARISVNDRFEVEMHQHGLLRPLRAPELSDGTLRYILLAAALLSPRPPELMVLNEPEASLHPDLLEPLGRLMGIAAKNTQLVVVSHAQQLVAALTRDPKCYLVACTKDCGETFVDRHSSSVWNWPKR